MWGGRAAHRRVYRIVRGEPEGVLHHRCRNRLCVNPWHMQDVPDQSTHMALHPDNPGYFPKGHQPWSTDQQMRDAPSVISGQRRYLTTVKCDGCGRDFQVREDLRNRGRRSFCSRRCYWDHKGPDTPPRKERDSNGL